jgi:septum formation protein
MRAASAEEIRSYVETGEPMDKAGAYAVQGIGGTLVEKVVGSLDNVIGLPVAEVLATWARLRETKLREKRR